MSSDFYTNFILPYAGIIIKICRAYTNTQEDFEDFYQEVCLQIWKSRENYREDSDWSTWIYRITLNVCLTLIRKEKREKSKRDSQIDTTLLTEENKAFKDESLNLLYEAIKSLKEVDRAIILLYLEEKSYKEIAAIIGVKANAVGVRINRIKERLKKQLYEKVN
ncbi:RNA polymerase sigma factor [Algivirga pacifica]|uniref:RNA polymerase sigma factor n=1 Tax=Algivirga pacifica TaxID=1162670 RepID=A0ABP9DDL1_9BACT